MDGRADPPDGGAYGSVAGPRARADRFIRPLTIEEAVLRMDNTTSSAPPPVPSTVSTEHPTEPMPPRRLHGGVSDSLLDTAVYGFLDVPHRPPGVRGCASPSVPADSLDWWHHSPRW